MRRALSMAPLLALAAGCLVAPSRTHVAEPPEPPARFAAPGAAEPAAETAGPERWWALLGDPDLEAAIEEAFRQSHDLAGAAARVEAALAEARAAGAVLSPTVHLAGDAGRQRQNFVGLPIPDGSDVLSSTFTTYGVSLDVSWEPDLWGRLRAQGLAAGGEAQAAAADLAAAHLSLAGQIAKVWFALAEARLQAELAERTAAAYAANAEVLRERFRIGRAQALDLHLLENQLAAARALHARRGEQESLAALQLELLLGRTPRGRGPETELLAARGLPEPPGSVPTGLPAQLAERRPDLVAEAARLEALDWRLHAARAELLPALRLTGAAGRRSAELGDLLRSDFDVWSLGAGLVQPLFQGGRLRAGVDAADARARAALERYAGAYLSALAEVESALSSEEHLALREEHLGRAAREAEAARSLAEERYFQGLSDVLPLLEAERRTLAAESELLLVRRLRLDARVDLFLSLGGGFGAEPPPLLEPHVARAGER